MATVYKSKIDNQLVDVEQLIVPEGRLLASAPTLTAVEGAIAYNLTDDRLYVSDGSVWKDIAGQSNMVMSTFGATPNAEGATISSPVGPQTLTLQPASASFPGGVSATGQSFAGLKYFINGIQLDAGFTGPTGSGTGAAWDYEVQSASQLINGTLDLTGAVTGSVNFTMAQMNGNIFLHVLAVQPTAGSAATTIISQTGAVPQEYLDVLGGNVVPGICWVCDNNVASVGAFRVNLDGSIEIGTSVLPDNTLGNFSGTTNNGFPDFRSILI